ncbi:MAG: type II secretion system protein [Microgenomates group bacterium]
MKKVKGFTMIELLIVIAVLGILAVAVLAAINPIEQINRSRDTGSRSDAEQLIGAIDRFYTANGYYPWVDSADNPDYDQPWRKVDMTWVDNLGNSVLTKLSDPTQGTAEIKESFVDRITDSEYNSLYIYNNGQQGGSTYVCFMPKSANFLNEANRRAGQNCAGLPPDLQTAGCDNICPGGKCFSCLP